MFRSGTLRHCGPNAAEHRNPRIAAARCVQHGNYRARLGQRLIHRPAKKRINPCALGQGRAQDVGCFLVKSDPPSHEETIRN